MEKFTSDLSGKEYPITERVTASMVRQPIKDIIIRENPNFRENGCLSMSELNLYREKYISQFLDVEMGQLSQMEDKVLEILKDKALISGVTEDEDAFKSTFGQRIADRVATFGGSWTFIIIFMAILVTWISANVFLLANKGFDPYPFILLNLILSCIAALQAPVIMMSQNRQEEKDRIRAKNDYMVNLKAEVEIRMLHE